MKAGAILLGVFLISTVGSISVAATSSRASVPRLLWVPESKGAEGCLSQSSAFHVRRKLQESAVCMAMESLLPQIM